jgi:hypothetical protein
MELRLLFFSGKEVDFIEKYHQYWLLHNLEYS